MFSLPSQQEVTAVLCGYVSFQLLSALSQSLPDPTQYGGVWYKCFYNFFSILVADFKSFLTSKGAAPK